ncbi:MAG: hypothetical protein J1E84_01395 [Muribaculaceae bacterium]|nr:hypothetical protein [Muribaculaceae bacterium]
MSKSTLRKELAGFDAEQLREIILDLYSAKKEAKEYLDFFINPDLDKLNNKTLEALGKEIGRVKRRYVSPRWTRVNALIKNYASLNPGAEHVINIYWSAVKIAAVEMTHYYVSPTFEPGFFKLFDKMLEYGDKNQVLDIVLPDVLKYIDNTTGSSKKSIHYIGINLKQRLELFRPSMR